MGWAPRWRVAHGDSRVPTVAYLGPAEKGMKASGDRPWLFSGLNRSGL